MNCDKKLHSLREETQLVIGAARKDTLLESAKTKLKANTDKITPGSRKRVKNNNVLKAYQRRSIRARNIGTELEIRSMTKRGNTTLRSQIRKTVQAQTRVPAQIQVLLVLKDSVREADEKRKTNIKNAMLNERIGKERNGGHRKVREGFEVM